MAVLAGQLTAAGRAAGLAAVGIAPAEPFVDTRRHLIERKARGLDAGMQFTYRNPERSTDPRRILPGARSLVVGALSYREGEQAGRGHGQHGHGQHGLDQHGLDQHGLDQHGLDQHKDDRAGEDQVTGQDARRDVVAPPTGLVARYARSDHYAALREALGHLTDQLRAAGWQATVVCDDNALVDRAAAQRAGLGWFGRNSLLLLPELGSWFLLGSVVTDAPLPHAKESERLAHASGCRSCTACQQACPTGALDEAGVVDANRCLAWVVQAPGSIPVELRQPMGRRIYGCDECQVVCPVNRVADRRQPADVLPSDGAVDLLGLLAASDGELLSAFGRFYIAGRDPRHLRRNALVALGNVGRGDDLPTVATLQHWLAVDDELLNEHAAWAARQLGRDDLVDGHSRPVPDDGAGR